jgi:hypothetical protein
MRTRSFIGAADDIELVAQTGLETRVHHRAGVGTAHLDDGAEFLVEQDAEQRLV